MFALFIRSKLFVLHVSIRQFSQIHTRAAVATLQSTTCSSAVIIIIIIITHVLYGNK